MALFCIQSNFKLGSAMKNVVILVAVLCLGVDGFAQNKPIYTSPTVTHETPGHRVSITVNIESATDLYLVANDSGDGMSFDWCNWVNPVLKDGQKSFDLTQLKWKSATAGFGSVRVNKNCGGAPMRINDQKFSTGFGTHANSVIHFALPKKHRFNQFSVAAGLDNDGTDQGGGRSASVKFMVFTKKPPQKYYGATRRTHASADHGLEKVLSQFDIHPDLEIGLFAAEPRLVNPTNIDIDHLGRVWVCEVVNYRGRRNSRPQGDRILILEDTDGDAKADRQTVFYQGRDIDSVHGICVLGDRALVSAGSQVFYLIDTNGDGKADKKEVLFTGIGGTQHDHGIHAFVFGPDGKLYFNFGNSGQQIKDKHGKPIVDVAGQTVNERSRPYQQGMVFRCNMDGSEFETLGWNFRNNWEVCVDSWGRLWQSDNDDDGNRGVRINYVMPFGNYGYRDEFTRAGWRSPRTNIETEIPHRHWHLNDPGVVPNLLQTGGGSPTGICFYEGTALPAVFHNQIIHCDAGPNIVRAYTVLPDGVGFKSKIINIMDGSRHNKWFRPSDVCVAPDGSLMVADWYDPGVGGHGMGDIQRGRLFRLTAKGHGKQYKFVKPDFSTFDGCLRALQSCNMATRFMAWKKMMSQREPAKFSKIDLGKRRAIEKWIQHDNELYAARALWLLANFDETYARQPIQKALFGDRAMVAETAVKALCQMSDKQFVEKTISEFVKRKKEIPDNVSREILLAMSHRQKHKFSDEFVLEVVNSLKKTATNNRWLVEVLGIALEKRWDAYLAKAATDTPIDAEIIWRSRGQKTTQLLAERISDSKVSAAELLRLFRAMDFQSSADKPVILRRLAFRVAAKLDADDPRKNIIFQESVSRLGNITLTDDEKQQMLGFVDSKSTNVADKINAIAKFDLHQRFALLPDFAIKHFNNQFGSQAVQAIYKHRQTQLLDQQLVRAQQRDAAAKNKTAEFEQLIHAIARVPKTESVQVLVKYASDKNHPLEPRKLAVRKLGDLYGGCKTIIQWAESKKYDRLLEPAMVAAIYSARWNDIRAQARKLFPLKTPKGKPMPNVAQLVRKRGDRKQGQIVYAKAGTCATCHVVNGVGKTVGPDLSEIGKKLSKTAMYESILFPSASISHNYEMWRVTTTDGELIDGVLVSETDKEIVLVDAKANRLTIKTENVDEKVRQKISIMPDNLREAMTDQQLVDLVEYLMSLKKAKK